MGSSVILPTPGQPKEGPDPSFKSAAIPNVVSFEFQHVDPPSSVYIQRDDVLVLEAFSQTPNEVVTIAVRLLIPLAPQPGQPDSPLAPSADPRGSIGPGYIQTIQRTLPVPVALTAATLQIPLMEGYLLSVSLASAIAPNRGQTFGRVFINRGVFQYLNPNVAAMLLADYISRPGPVGWPGGRQVSPTEGPGFFTQYLPANPAPGADLTATSNSSGRVRLVCFSARFTASAAAANRVVSFTIAGLGTYLVQDTANVVASQVVNYSLASGGTNVRGVGAGTAANPIDVTLPAPSPAIGSVLLIVSSATQNIQAADQWSNINLTTEEWFDQL